MGRFVKGDVVIVPFPFSDLSSTKRRPALVAATLGTGDDVVLCQITSRTVADNFSIHIAESDFVTGGLRRKSNVRPNRLFTADTRIILYRAGQLSIRKMRAVTAKIIEIISA
jgi:mRNA interferase MazF